MALAVDGASAAAHGESHDGAVPFVRLNMVFLLHRRHQFLEEEVFISSPRDIEIAVPLVVEVGVSSVGHDYDHPARLARGNQLVNHVFHVPHGGPGGISVRKAMQQVDDRVLFFTRLVESLGKIDVEAHFLSEDTAGDAVGTDFTIVQGLCHGAAADKQQG